METIRKSDAGHGAPNVRRVMKLHRCAQLQVENFNTWYAPMNALLHVILISVIIAAIYGSVRIEGWFGFALGYM